MLGYIPGYVASALSLIRAAGFEAFPVGGCVRDLLLGKTPHDWDVASSAGPAELLEIFRGFRIAPLSGGGLRHGTVTVIFDRTPLEITSYRLESDYSDGRHPDSVSFSRRLSDDLCRRDFTINALCIGEKGEIIDLFGGREDLAAGIIRAIGNPSERFGEDALRIIRALRFSASLGFEIEQKTARSMIDCLGRLELLASERVCSELQRLICAPHFLEAALAHRGVFAAIIPEMQPMVGLFQREDYHCFDVFEHSVRAAAAIEPEPELRLAMLLHDIGKPACSDGAGHFHGHEKAGAALAEDILRRFNISRARRERVCALIARHSQPLSEERLRLKRLMARFGEEFVLCLIKMQRADNMAMRPDIAAPRLARLEKIESAAKALIAERPPLSLSQLAVSGADILALGVAPGPEVGRLLGELLSLVIAERLPNEQEALLRHAAEKAAGR